MTAIVTAAEITAHLESMGAVELRKLGATMKIKGASKGKKADLVAAISEIRIAEMEALKAELELAAEAEAASAALPSAEAEAIPAPKKGMCDVCSKRRKAPKLNGQCEPCFEEGSWENEHSDRGHENGEKDELCWICHPELNEAQREPKAGRSRAGMVIVAKGTEIHKSETFRVAAEAAGWSVNVLGSVVTEKDGEEIERFTAVATKGDDIIDLSWNGRAYDYPTSYAKLNGKVRKVRNLKEALRLL